MKHIITVTLFLSVLVGCACPKAYGPESIKDSDKALTCKDVVMEINEAEFFRRSAQNSAGMNMDVALNPFCYPSTYNAASKAGRNADQRLEYLSQIYELLGCGRRRPVATAPQQSYYRSAPGPQAVRPVGYSAAPVRQHAPYVQANIPNAEYRQPSAPPVSTSQSYK